MWHTILACLFTGGTCFWAGFYFGQKAEGELWMKLLQRREEEQVGDAYDQVSRLSSKSKGLL